MLRLLKVSGNSLSPGYQEGDFVVIVKIPLFLHPYHHGDVIVFHHPHYGRLIKRIKVIDIAQGAVYVAGDHPESLDSRQLGPISLNALEGKVIWHIKKPRT